MKCPSCGFEQDAKNTECEKCQIIFAKWFARNEPKKESAAEAYIIKKRNIWKENLIWFVALLIAAGIFGIRYANKKASVVPAADSSIAVSAQIALISSGEEVDILKHVVKGKITVFDFYADWCGPCHVLAPKLDELAASDPEIIIRKIDIKDWKSPVAKQYKLRSIPNVRVYNKKGEPVGEPSAGFEVIKNNILKCKE